MTHRLLKGLDYLSSTKAPVKLPRSMRGCDFCGKAMPSWGFAGPDKRICESCVETARRYYRIIDHQLATEGRVNATEAAAEATWKAL